MNESSDYNELDFRTIENDCKDAKSHFDNYKYAYIEKLKKEQCLTKLKEKSSFESEQIQKLAEINKNRLKNIKKTSHDFEQECTEKSKILYARSLERQHNQQALEAEKNSINDLNKKLKDLIEAEELMLKENEKEERLRCNLQCIEDKINEYEKIAYETDEENIKYLEKVLADKKEELKSIDVNFEKDSKNEDVEELYKYFKITREFFEEIFDYKISKIEMIKDGFKLLIEGHKITLWIMIENFSFVNMKIIKSQICENEINKMFLICKKFNDPVCFIRQLVYL
ncbi:hypothetical protein COBT_000139 [Conglomerata obtusa]